MVCGCYGIIAIPYRIPLLHNSRYILPERCGWPRILSLRFKTMISPRNEVCSNNNNDSDIDVDSEVGCNSDTIASMI